MAKNVNKSRKSKAQELFDEADNSGRFAGKDSDVRNARKQAVENIGQEKGGARKSRGGNEQSTDKEARRDWAKSHDYKGEAQNVTDDTGRPLNEDELAHSRNKAKEGLRQKRDTSDSGTSDRTTSTGRTSEDIY